MYCVLSKRINQLNRFNVFRNFFVAINTSPHSPILLTANGATPSMQQAVGSSISAIISYMAPLGVPRWSFAWVLDDGVRNVFLFQFFFQNNLIS